MEDLTMNESFASGTSIDWLTGELVTPTTTESVASFQVVADQQEDQYLTTADRIGAALALVWGELASRASDAAFIELLVEVYASASADAAGF